MIHEMDEWNREASSRPLYLVMTKSSILYSSSIISSFILFVLYLSSDAGYGYSIFHSFINGMVLLLMDHLHNGLYRTLCWAPHRLSCLAMHVPLSPRSSKSRSSKSKSDDDEIFREDRADVRKGDTAALPAGGGDGQTNTLSPEEAAKEVARRKAIELMKNLSANL